MQILTAKLGIIPDRHLGRLHQQHAQETIALLGDGTQPLLARRTVFPGNQAQIAGNLLAPLKTGRVSDGQYKGQRGDRSHARLCHQQTGSFIFLGCFFHRQVQPHHLLVHGLEQFQKISPAFSRPVLQRQLP